MLWLGTNRETVLNQIYDLVRNGFSYRDMSECESRERIYLYNRLAQEKEDERDAYERLHQGRR